MVIAANIFRPSLYSSTM